MNQYEPDDTLFRVKSSLTAITPLAPIGTGSKCHLRAGWNNSTKLPEGSTSRICEPPGPVTMSLRNWTLAARSRATSAGKSSTMR